MQSMFDSLLNFFFVSQPSPRQALAEKAISPANKLEYNVFDQSENSMMRLSN